jgi:predicted small secreted protein
MNKSTSYLLILLLGSILIVGCSTYKGASGYGAKISSRGYKGWLNTDSVSGHLLLEDILLYDQSIKKFIDTNGNPDYIKGTLYSNELIYLKKNELYKFSRSALSSNSTMISKEAISKDVLKELEWN